MTQSEEALRNIDILSRNTYPGRGIIVGKRPNGAVIMISWIMGRSENSRNRVYGHDGNGRVYTEAADPAKVKDPSLIIYNAMDEVEYTYIASNGSQTDLIHLVSRHIGANMLEHGFKYEPDAPNFTPRITGLYNRRNGLVEMAIHRKSPWSDAVLVGSFLYTNMEPGFGRCLTTYTGDGDPLPSFTGEPFMVPIPADLGLDHLAEIFRNILNRENFVALAAKEIDPRTGRSEIYISNRYERVAPKSAT